MPRYALLRAKKAEPERGSPEDEAERKSCPRGEPENFNGAAHTAD